MTEVNRVLNIEMQKLEEWVRNNGMKINVEKTKTMMFRSSHKGESQEPLLIYSENQVIDQVRNFKYLGFLLDEKLLWNDHCEIVCKNVSSRIKLITRYKKYF